MHLHIHVTTPMPPERRAQMPATMAESRSNSYKAIRTPSKECKPLATVYPSLFISSIHNAFRSSIISRLDPDENLLQESFKKAGDFSAHPYFSLLVPLI